MTSGDLGRSAPVSVVIPCYRCRKTIHRAVSSVAAQSSLPAEVILVDDGSADGTLEYLQELVASYPSGWLKLIALAQNQGAADARNAGWAVATQPYVAFLDSDDSWHPRKIEVQYGYMSSHPEVDLSAHPPRQLTGDSTPVDKIDGYSVRAITKLSILMSNSYFGPTVMMLKRDLPFRYLRGRRRVDDHLLWLQLVYAGYSFVDLSAILAYTHKAPYGESGLSSRLWLMERDELVNFWILRREGSIGLALTLVACSYSFAKFLRRVLIVFVRSRSSK